ncbi:Cellulose synthase-like protein B3 [Linum perenne]
MTLPSCYLVKGDGSKTFPDSEFDAVSATTITDWRLAFMEGPLYEKLPLKYYTHRALDIVVTLLLATLLVYRLLHLHSHGFPWLIALLCESWFTFLWLLTVSMKWTPAFFKTYPERLLNRVEEAELPPVDMFVTTADPELEPPIITVNTVISLMAVDYPVNKLACYVSDDGCSPLTYYSLVEASKFAKLWVPFCKKYNVQVRAPFRYFSSAGSDESINPADESPEFRQECQQMKEAYRKLTRKIEEASAMNQSSLDGIIGSDSYDFANMDRKNHPTIVKVIWENKEYGYSSASSAERLPHLVYISREKRPKYPHHYKAGAMNVLTRVSGVMTNAPFMMNVDCDMYANNPHIVRHAMCIFLGASNERETGFVQFPQCFYGALKDDPFGNQMVVLYQVMIPSSFHSSNETEMVSIGPYAAELYSDLLYIGSGIAGIQGPFYGGTGCFHRRKVIYGLVPNEVRKQGRILSHVHENLSEKELLKTFGNSKDLTKSAALALKGQNSNQSNTSKSSLSDLIEAANHVSGCDYESATNWGKAYVGWQYGSTTEDVLTGLTIHARAAPLAVYTLYTLLEYFQTGLSIRAWWNNQKIPRIVTTGPRLFSVLSVACKILGLSETVFEVTQKDSDDQSGDVDASRFTFDGSPIFVPGTTLVIVSLAGLGAGLVGGGGLGEIVVCLGILALYKPFVEGLFRKGKYGIPLSTIGKSVALALLLVVSLIPL